MAALLSLARAASQLARAAPLIERAAPLLLATPELREHSEPIGRLAGDIALRNISFRYTENGPLVVDNLSLDIPAGSFVAFVGPSGSGKSTVLRLLLGFETPQGGEVLYDGLSSDRIDPRSLRSQIGVVLQNGQIFSGSILDNILGPAGLGIEHAWAAARMVGLDSDIEAMPMGMHTVLLDGGSGISGGQRQRILIARALVHRPRILLFDEATSALDNRTQAIVTETLTRLSITRIVIAHRLSTIEDVDTVFVVDRGRLVQQGGFRELLEQPGPFYELARRQIAE
jgi:ABC-type bacteriocin/lantibiotic exporter with double-glycine peptidase domain